MPRSSHLLLLFFVLSAGALPLFAAEIDYVNVEKEGKRYFVEGEIVIEGSVNAVFRLITDYDALENLDKGIAESRLIERVDNIALVYTKLKGCVVFFCRNVERIERVEEISGSELVAHVVPEEGGNVSYERSQWNLSQHDSGTRIVFRTEVEPDFWIPAVIGPSIIRNVLKRRVSRTLGALEQAARAYE